MREAREYALDMLVENKIGVLTRLTTQIRREGLNIRSLHVDVTDNPLISRVTMRFPCMSGFYRDVLERFSRMNCVLEIHERTQTEDRDG